MALHVPPHKVDFAAPHLQTTAMIAFPNISPEIFSVTLFGMTFALRWYAMAYIVGILLGWWLMARLMRRPALWPGDTAPATPAQLESFLTWVVIGVIAGGRLGYVILYKPLFYLQNPWQIPILWEGGMSFHGGFIGVVLATLLYARSQKIPLSGLSDAIAIGATPAIFLVRIANFINAELWGRPTTLPWGVAFPGDAAQFCPGVEGICARHPSQLYEAILEGLILGTLLLWLAYRRGALKSPWLVSGTFFAVYGLSRFLVEFVRQPDAHFASADNPLGLALHWGGYGLTMGQVLSIPMILAGLAVILAARRRGT
jgi:phosphatidylglycerol---prolipoprotein diacylglyceryl transferase